MSDEDPASSTSDDVDAAAEELSKSALADNISKKGKNAYYYAHAHKADGPKVRRSCVYRTRHDGAILVAFFFHN
jgi:hypothetical protein